MIVHNNTVDLVNLFASPFLGNTQFGEYSTKPRWEIQMICSLKIWFRWFSAGICYGFKCGEMGWDNTEDREVHDFFEMRDRELNHIRALNPNVKNPLKLLDDPIISVNSYLSGRPLGFRLGRLRYRLKW